MARVGLNLVFLVPGETGGMEIYARALLPRLAAARPHWEWTAFVNRETARVDGPWQDMRCETVPVHARSRVEWVRGEQQHLPRLATRAGIDLLHSLGSTAPARGRFVRVATVHDLNYLRVAEAHLGMRGLGMRVLVPLSVRTSHRVIADSASTRDDLVAELRTDPAKIDVVHLGVTAEPTAPPLPEGEVRARHGLGDRAVVLCVAAKRPHKNLARLFDALALLEPGERPVLVVPGYSTAYEAKLRAHAAALGVADDVRLTAWVDDAELEGLYACCTAFVFPSLYEGFGLPVAEAMRRGVPVACSDRASLPEVAGGAARLFDPDDPAAIAAAVRELLAGGPGVERLRTAGRARAAELTWERCAEGTLAAYERALPSSA